MCCIAPAPPTSMENACKEATWKYDGCIQPEKPHQIEPIPSKGGSGGTICCRAASTSCKRQKRCTVDTCISKATVTTTRYALPCRPVRPMLLLLWLMQCCCLMLLQQLRQLRHKLLLLIPGAFFIPLPIPGPLLPTPPCQCRPHRVPAEVYEGDQTR